MRRKYALCSPEDGGEGSAGGDLPVADPVDESSDSSVDWAGMDAEFAVDETSEVVEGDSVVVEAPAAVVTEAPVGTPSAAPVTEAPKVTPPVTPPATSPVVPPAPAPVIPPAPTPPQGKSEENTASQPSYTDWRSAREQELSTTTYAVNDEDAAALLTEPETVLPRMAARMHMEVLEHAMRSMQVMVPQLLEQVQQSNQANTSAKTFFHGLNPDLADPAYEPAILELGKVYRRVNQDAPPEVAARAIGNLVRAALGISAPGAGGQPPASVQQAQPVAMTPFVPARGAGGGVSQPISSNAFEALAREWEHDE